MNSSSTAINMTLLPIGQNNSHIVYVHLIYLASFIVYTRDVCMYVCMYVCI